MPRLSFPPPPPALRGRASEVETLVQMIRREHPTALALVGPGGSGKSTLAAAVGHALASDFPGGVHWFRVAEWTTSTLLTMLAIRFGTSRQSLVRGLKRRFSSQERALIVLDNHEDDEAVAGLLNRLSSCPLSWIVTARRCLLAGLTIYPVNPPLVLRGASPYRSVASLTRLLRHNPLSLSIADALVRSGSIEVDALERYLVSNGAGKVQVIADEDDLPEVRLLVDWVWKRLPGESRRMLGVLAHAGGDHVDAASLLALARAKAGSSELTRLVEWRLVQEPFEARYALHATIRRAVLPRARSQGARQFEHYVSMLEKHPERLDAEQTHLFAAMDYAQSAGKLQDRLRLADLLRNLGL